MSKPNPDPSSRKPLSLRSAKTMGDLCRLNSDNFSCKDYWITAGERDVTLAQQCGGSPPTAEITIPRSQFNALIDFYNRKQARKPNAPR